MAANQDKKSPGFVLWLTGLPCSGKTTIAVALARALQELGLAVEHLDGDQIRSLFPQTGFDRDSRNRHLRQMAFIASRLAHHGINVVASFVSPYTESRSFVRNICPNFIEVFVSTPLAECEARDVKGMYAKARRGEIPDFTGISDPYEPPPSAEIELDTSSLSIDLCLKQILSLLEERDLIAQAVPVLES